MDDHDVIYTENIRGPLQRLSVEFARGVRLWSIERHQRGSSLDRNALNQIYRAGTSVGANIREAQYAESKKDFVHKLKIAEKEIGEFYYWLGLLMPDSEEPIDESTMVLENLAQQVRKLLIAIIVKTKENMRNSSR